MKDILLFGAGRSSTSLIDYLIGQLAINGWRLTVMDANINVAREKTVASDRAQAASFDINDEEHRSGLIAKHDLVISMLPAHLHILVAQDCLRLNRHLCNASYVSAEMEELAAKAAEKGLIFMGELGLDPGLDHMSAMECIDSLKRQGAEITGFKSYTGGLVAPESDNNPWHYKISWNPRNVVLAGKGTATYLSNGELKYIPYHNLFDRSEEIEVKGIGTYDGYANRDSLSYRRIYGIESIPTLIRGTLRYPGYCRAWNALINLGYTDDALIIENSHNMTLKEVTTAFLPEGKGSVKERVADYLNEDISSDVMAKLDYLGIFDDIPIHARSASPAGITEEIITEKWKLQPSDRDMILMQHEFSYKKKGKPGTIFSTLCMKGDDAVHTAMSKSVGLPLAVFVCMVMKGAIEQTSNPRPVEPHVYRPVLKELKHLGIKFNYMNAGGALIIPDHD